jgi:hypothetical protein
MPWELSEDLEAFTTEAGAFLRSRPVEHTVFLTLVEALRTRGLQLYGSGAPVFGWWRADSGAVEGALLQTPPYPMMFTALPAEAVPAAVDAVAGRPLTGANLLARDVEVFVAGWRKRTGATDRVAMRTRLHLLGSLTPPSPAPDGGPRTAGPGDEALLLRWHREFYDEIGEEPPPTLAGTVDDRLRRGRVTLWEAGGEPVSMAARSGAQAGMVRIQAVYTPKELRGRGYAGGATAVCTRAALDDGAGSVVLVTDLANPTSNALYHRLGYRPVEDRVVVEFRS